MNMTSIGCYITHWGRHQMATIFQITFWNPFSWMKMWFRFKFHWSLFPINNIPALIQIMAWHRPDDKPSSESMMFGLATHICVTQPHWVKINKVCWRIYGWLNWYIVDLVTTFLSGSLNQQSGKTSNRQISWSVEPAGLGVMMIVSHWNLAGIPTALLPRCL